MELEFRSPSSPSEWAITSTITLLFLILLRKILKPKTPTPNLPPGPKKLPLIGNIHQLIGGIPHQKMRDLSQIHGPIMHLKLGELENVIISSKEAAEKILKTHDVLFAQRPQMIVAKSVTYDFHDITFSPYGDYWRQLRKITMIELLAAKRVLSFRAIREEETTKLVELIRGFQSGESINFTRMIDSTTYGITSRAACGKIWEGENLFISSLEKIMFEVGSGISFADAYPSVKLLKVFSGIRIRVDRLQKNIDKIFESIIEEHREERKGRKKGEDDLDLVDVLLNLQESGTLEIPLSDVTIKAVIMDMFVAGVDTSAATTEWLMSELIKNPEVMKKAQAEIREKFKGKASIDEADLQDLHYLKLVIKETFRLHPSVPLLVPRECRESCVIEGYDIPVKTKIMVNAWAMGRDTKYWGEDAEKFKPERFIDSPIDFKGHNFEYLPFGSGRRSCPGMAFGVANVEIAVAKLLYHFDWRLGDGMVPENLDMTEKIGGTTRRLSELYIIPTPYVPQNSA
ncbi:cytochrome P450 71D445 [Euphorbia lathyris]|uniref:Cytochrome P450 71D445 n=1 Tax=Euphorbia lathyris TaxID=212925 RepID=C7D45_EUPLT|nr:RecName: Full=Cytochrome P450 71D445; Short=ElCYP71D445; AltName: Full=4,5,8-trihydroxycasbene synthase; AltName: Full=4,8-dihydroxycasbene synthase; AltName: Full=8-hydroxycasbene synthase [Euphorbia lathyris]AMY98418.1 cytochrome P450 CYP71D445 [Euphorbia lathyris]